MSASPSRRRTAGPLVAVVLALLGSVLQVGVAGTAAGDVLAPGRVAALMAGSTTSLSLAASPAAVGRGGGTTLTGRLTDPATGAGVTGATVQVEVQAPDGAWAAVGSAVTDSTGSLAVAEVVDSSTTYRLHFGEPVTAEESASPPVTVTVLPLTAGFSQPAVRVGRPVTVTGVLAAGEGQALRVERRVGDGWALLGRTTTGPGGAYSVPVTPTTPGFWQLRVVSRGPGAGSVEAVLPRLDSYRLHTYRVRTRGVVQADMDVFRQSVAATYADPRGWQRAHHRFRPAAPGRPGDFTVVLAEARYLPGYSWECSSSYSCRVGRNVIINQTRWRFGSRHFPGTLEEYRSMVVNHETGHWLGRGHAYCPAPGRLAPVMQQQSKGMQGCRVNPWPLPRELRAVS